MHKKIYSIKMRASRAADDGAPQHVSGAERIVPERDVQTTAASLLERALKHANGEPNCVNLRLELQDARNIQHLEVLPVRTIDSATPEEGLAAMTGLLEGAGVPRAAEIVAMLPQAHHMRGAMMVDADTLERLEPDPRRGVRATCMDAGESTPGVSYGPHKNHYAEAIVLATKVANAPNIIAELCISDDSDYCTGYIASRELGYVRITRLKHPGDARGGRIFLYRGDPFTKDATIRYLEHQCVLVSGVRPLSSADRLDPRPPDRLTEIKQELETLKADHLHREIRPIDGAQGPRVVVDGREMLMFSSNNYLDLANDARVKNAAAAAIGKYGVGSGASRLTSGSMPPHSEVEELVAEFKGTEAAITFATGYMANVGCIQALCGKDDVVFSDELNHASIIDGCRLSRARVVVYRHNDMVDLEEKILLNPGVRGMIVSDGVFSMDGDIVNLPALLDIASRYGLLSVIDEAHATGVLGETGRGVCEHFGVDVKPDVIIGTFSKAVGSEGGFCCGSGVLVDYIRNKARSFIFSTAPSPAAMAATAAGLRIIMEEPWRVAALRRNVALFLEALSEHGIRAESQSAIIPIIVGGEAKAMEISRALHERGIHLSAIRYPTVGRGAARLRAAIMATHAEDDLRRAAAAIGELCI